MKIRFLGTADVFPRKDACCSSTMLEIGEHVYLIDAGAPVSDLLLQYDKRPDQLRAIFTTHAHSDHIEGLFTLMNHCIHIYPTASFQTVLTEQKIANLLCSSVETLFSCPFPQDRIKLQIAEAGPVYHDAVLKATYIPVSPNEGLPSFAILIEAENKKILFTGDLSQWLADDDFPKIAFEEELDLIVCEFAHFTAKQLTPYMRKCRTKLFCFNHYKACRLPELEELMQSESRHFPVQAMKDGDEIML